MEDLKFTMRKACLIRQASGTLTLANKTLPVKTLEANPIRTFNGTGLIRIFTKSRNLFY